MAHPKVAEAAVIGVPAPQVERAPAGLRRGQARARRSPGDEVLEFLDGRVAKWWLPDDVVFIDEVPKTSVGKFSKKDPPRPVRRLRAADRGGLTAGASAAVPGGARACRSVTPDEAPAGPPGVEVLRRPAPGRPAAGRGCGGSCSSRAASLPAVFAVAMGVARRRGAARRRPRRRRWRSSASCSCCSRCSRRSTRRSAPTSASRTAAWLYDRLTDALRRAARAWATSRTPSSPTTSRWRATSTSA